jgi:phytanoyl-CoA hydroxylase
VSSARLTADELAFLDVNGYVVRHRVFSPAEVAEIVVACETLVERLVRDRQLRRYQAGSYVFAPDFERSVMIKWEGDTDVVHGIEPFAHLDPSLRDWALDRRFIEPMQDFVGDPAPILFTEKLNLKRPAHGGVNPLHQDYPYWLDTAEAPERVATAMLLLDDADIDNGCLQVVPGSHRSGRWRNRTDSDEFGANEIDASAYPDVTRQPLPLTAGSVVMFGSFLVHCSAPNRSSRERRALLYSYQPAGHRTMVDSLLELAAVRQRAKAARAARAAD